MSQAVPKRSHHAKPLSGDAARVKASNASIKDFFSPPPKPGRPPGLPPKKRGRPAAPTPAPTPVAATLSPAATPSTMPTASYATAPPPRTTEVDGGKRAAAALLGTKLTRVNYGKGEALERLTRAVSDWDAKSGIHLQAEPGMSMPHVLQTAATHTLAVSPAFTMPTTAGREESASSDEESASSDEESASNSDPSDLDEEERAQMRALRETGSA